MDVISTELPGVLVVEPKVFGDARGFFCETWHAERFAKAGLATTFVQDNLSRSSAGVLRGLHYQWPRPQGKLVYVLEGEVLDVVVDIRRGSPTFGRSVSMALSAESKRQMYIPPGFAHGFCVLTPTVLFAYKCTEFYAPEFDRGILWNDPRLAIPWPTSEPTLSVKDQALPRLENVPPDLLPTYR